jgi:hypothetical protein
MTKNDETQTKLEFNKKTISNLTKNELGEVKAGIDQEQCWENLWTLYHCDVIYTADPL